MITNDPEKDDDIMASCLSFLTLNGNYGPKNNSASLIYEGLNDGAKTSLKAQITSFDIRKNQINVNFKTAKTTSSESYFTEATDLHLNCEKDETLKTMDLKKIKNDCLNHISISPFKLKIIDKLEQSTFNLDIKNITIKDKIVYLALNNGILSDTISSTYISNLLINCKKEIDTDLLELSMVLKDCLAYSRLSISEIKNSRPDKKESFIKNIAINSTNGALILQAEVAFLGIKAHVLIHGNISIDEVNKKLIIDVKDTKLPLGIHSVNFLMYILKKNIISKEIAILNNHINIQY